MLRAQRSQASLRLLVAVFFAALFGRMWSYTSDYASDLLYWDQWDFLSGIFTKASNWELFRWQHGPHRMGLGLWISSIAMPLTSWSMRAEGLRACVIFALAGLLALVLKTKLFGELKVRDALLLLCFLTLSFSESLVGVTILSHGPLPQLLVMLYCLTLLIPGMALRYGTLLILNFVAIHTGFALFLGLLTPVVLFLDFRARVAHKPWAVLVASEFIAMASLAYFFTDYVFQPAVACFKFPESNPLRYLGFMGYLMGGSLGWKGRSVFSLLLGLVLIAGMVRVAWISLRSLYKTPNENPVRALTLLVLTAFPLLFISNAAVGRVCLGETAGQVPRYLPYAFIGYFGLCLASMTELNMKRPWLPTLLLALLGIAEIKMYNVNIREGARLHAAKNSWQECYRALPDIRACDEATHFQIYPDPNATRFIDGLRFLEEHKR